MSIEDDRWLPTGPVPMGYHPALTAYVQGKTEAIQAGSVVFLTDKPKSGSKRRREDAVYIDEKNAHNTTRFAFAIDDISERKDDCVSLQTYGLLSAFVEGTALKVGMPVYPIATGIMNEKNVHLSTKFTAVNNYAGYIVSIDGDPKPMKGGDPLTVCRVFVDTCRHMAK